MKNSSYLALVLVALLCLAGWTAHAKLKMDVASPQPWEYMEVELDSTTDEARKLNELGAAQWELVGVTSICPTNNPGCRRWAYLKRPRWK